MAAETAVRSAETKGAFRLFMIRLHFYIGLFVAPFIFFAALSGTLYVLTPQIEGWLYRDQLVAATQGPARPLSEQVAAARQVMGEGPRLFAVRPAIAEGKTTRVMFTEPGLGESETRTIFVDPASLKTQGELVTYGTSGILPFRIALDYLHRNLLLGDIGRNYSELAASWLWIAVLGGVLLWLWRLGLPKNLGKAARERRLHGLIGIWMALGLLFLSVTGLTWSRWAGGNIDEFRNVVGWITPSVSVDLGGAKPAQPLGEHAEHQSGGAAPPVAAPFTEADTLAAIDRVVETARAVGIDSPMIEVRPPRTVEQAFRVSEYDRSWPTQVDTIAVDPSSMTVVSRADFATFPLVAKLIRWGIDTHMGVLFGVANQILMAAFGLGLMAMIMYGYRMWWLRRPVAGGSPRTLGRAFSHLSTPVKMIVLVVAIALGLALPAMGISLVVFLLIDLMRSALAEMIAADRRRGLHSGSR
ncbi:PepSY-associated TM helix domain-containing protein [Neorhizobium alkalisoli]|uniref:Putative iron-regulated membrane protein n=1 Tax=Neorhizobium alkalisoli TaxID=528178 RepID=A0A561QX12_9HYPH|nr:PepSY-associated TM helix domain-containing protein [Neorhizobium alkalisoli]TWF54915.1 putative iron-regulated membrane protein [Neorhizobium alkalisoli]